MPGHELRYRANTIPPYRFFHSTRPSPIDPPGTTPGTNSSRYLQQDRTATGRVYRNRFGPPDNRGHKSCRREPSLGPPTKDSATAPLSRLLDEFFSSIDSLEGRTSKRSSLRTYRENDSPPRLHLNDRKPRIGMECRPYESSNSPHHKRSW